MPAIKFRKSVWQTYLVNSDGSCRQVCRTAVGWRKRTIAGGQNSLPEIITHPYAVNVTEGEQSFALAKKAAGR